MARGRLAVVGDERPAPHDGKVPFPPGPPVGVSRVIVVGADARTRRLLTAVLELDGHQVEAIADRAALVHAGHASDGAIVIDLDEPALAGLLAMRALDQRR